MINGKGNAGKLCVRSETMRKVGKVMNLKLLSRSGRALLLEGICRELGEGKEKSRRRVALNQPEIGFEESVKRGEHMRALRFAQILRKKAKDTYQIKKKWVEELVECGELLQARRVVGDHGSGKNRIDVNDVVRSREGRIRAKYGERANELMELEDAIKWDGGISGKGWKAP